MFVKTKQFASFSSEVQPAIRRGHAMPDRWRIELISGCFGHPEPKMHAALLPAVTESGIAWVINNLKKAVNVSIVADQT